MASDLSNNAKKGFKEAQAYETYRPSYPSKVIDLLFDLIRAEPRFAEDGSLKGRHARIRIIDLAAGTGKLTELLAARQTEVASILAIEPHEQMRQVLAAKHLPNVEVRDGRADDMHGTPDCWADAITVAQAFHWFATAEALAEIGRCLKPSGILFLVWNEEDYNSPASISPSTAWERGLREIAWEQDQQQSGFRSSRKWHRIFDPNSAEYAQLNQAWSLPLAQESIEWTAWLSRDVLWQRYKSLSFITSLEVDALKEIEGNFDTLLDAEDTRRTEKGEIEVHGRTHIHWLCRK